VSPVPARRRYRVAFLAGDGVGPELVAEASRALAELGRLHGFRIEEEHVPFGRAAVPGHGHPLPPVTRDACRRADAVLVAATKEPALEGVKAELDLTWRVQRVLARAEAGGGRRSRRAPHGDLLIVSPLVEDADERTVERAFEIARTRRAHVAAVATRESFRLLVDEAAERHDGVIVERLALEEALPLLAHAPDRVDVVLTEAELAEALSEMAALTATGPRVVASGRLTEAGHGVFGPTHGSAPELAGQGVADPSGMILGASLMLGEGLGERAAAATLAGAVAEALSTGALTPDHAGAGTASTTREFMDVLLAALPGARTDLEFTVEVR
jgi:3-isopropylmalate dehydrogenase